MFVLEGLQTCAETSRLIRCRRQEVETGSVGYYIRLDARRFLASRYGVVFAKSVAKR